MKRLMVAWLLLLMGASQLIAGDGWLGADLKSSYTEQVPECFTPHLANDRLARVDILVDPPDGARRKETFKDGESILWEWHAAKRCWRAVEWSPPPVQAGIKS